MKNAKKCFVPTCNNNSLICPTKLFISVTTIKNRRIEWFKAVGHRKDRNARSTTTVYCCEDHFNLQEDLVHANRFKIKGGRLLIKHHIVPHLNLVVNTCPKNYSQFNMTPHRVRIKLQQLKKNKLVNHIEQDVSLLNSMKLKMANMLNSTNVEKKKVETVDIKIELEEHTVKTELEQVDQIKELGQVCDKEEMEEVNVKTELEEVHIKKELEELLIKTEEEDIVCCDSIKSEIEEAIVETESPYNDTIEDSSTTDKITLNYKYCFVPTCSNDSINSPNKMFLSITKGKNRKKWFRAVGMDIAKINAARHCCEDHFNLQEDLVNFERYKEWGGRLIIKPDINPHLNLVENICSHDFTQLDTDCNFRKLKLKSNEELVPDISNEELVPDIVKVESCQQISVESILPLQHIMRAKLVDILNSTVVSVEEPVIELRDQILNKFSKRDKSDFPINLEQPKNLTNNVNNERKTTVESSNIIKQERISNEQFERCYENQIEVNNKSPIVPTTNKQSTSFEQKQSKTLNDNNGLASMICKIHPGNQSRYYQCHYCFERFASVKYCIAHESLHTKVVQHACRTCKKQFLLYNDCSIHERKHTFVIIYRCYACDAKLKEAHWKRHECLKSPEKGRRKRAILEKRTFTIRYVDDNGKLVEERLSTKNVNSGKQTVDNSVDNTDNCVASNNELSIIDRRNICTRVTNRRIIERPEVKAHLTVIRMYRCNICRQLSDNWNVHKLHKCWRNYNLYRCKFCGENFKLEINWKIHESKHYPYHCKFCGRFFSDLDSFKEHNMTKQWIKRCELELFNLDMPGECEGMSTSDECNSTLSGDEKEMDESDEKDFEIDVEGVVNSDVKEEVETDFIGFDVNSKGIISGNINVNDIEDRLLRVEEIKVENMNVDLSDL